MVFEDAFAAARKAGLGSFRWRGKKYTTDIAQQQSAPYIEDIPIEVETGLVEPYIDRAWNPVAAMAAYQADAGLRNAGMPPTGQISIPGVRVPSYGYGGCILPDIVLF